MPRIREYAGYGNQNSNKETETEQERSYRVSEVTPEESQEKESDATSVTKAASAEEREEKTTENFAAAQGQQADGQGDEPPKLIIEESDLTPKYTEEQPAIESIMEDGIFYEDYLRGEKAELFKSKEFVLAAIAQSYDRYYAPQTPKTADWIDELYLTERAAYFFEQTKEGTKEEENAVFAADLYAFLRKSAFSSEAYQIVDRTLKRVAKAASARIASPEDAERMRKSLARFQAAVNSAMTQVKEKHAAALAAKEARKQKLGEDKKQLAGMIDEMKFIQKID